MRTIKIHALATTALAILAVAPAAATQSVSSPILNALDVQTLVANATSSDHARISAHFAALAERYAARATRHKAIARALMGNPARRGAAGDGFDHRMRLADLNSRSAETLRVLAGHYSRLAAGQSSQHPGGGAQFLRGAGALPPTDAQVRAVASRAKTPADHRWLEEYLVTAARRYTAEANAHAATAATYRGTRIAQAAAHCDRLAAIARERAEKALARAAVHQRLASIAG